MIAEPTAAPGSDAHAAPPPVGGARRGDRLADLKPRYPVVIIGGGINGCGLFRDLSLQGVDCLLVDKTDFCAGASAAPSRLIHGGIKYLETGEFRLVAQSAMERNLLVRNAPHYCKPLPTVLPITSWFGGLWPSILRFLGRPAKMADRGAAIIEIGLQLYDLFGRRFRAMPRHALWSRARARREMPELNPAIVAAGLYYEGRITHAERIGLELVLDGLAANRDSRALNHVAVTGATADGLVLTDRIEGGEAHVSADLVVNAGGAWIDKVNGAMGVATRHMGGNKGSHLVVRNARLHDALGGRMVYFGSPDGRVNLLYPFFGNVLIGSTDIPVDDPDAAVCTEAETRYLIDVVATVFPAIPIAREQVVFTYCGVRPLPASDAADPGAVTRDHSITEDRLADGTPVLSLIGGKWTTFRGFAEEAADRVLSRLDRRRRTDTRALPIGGGRDFPRDEAAADAYVRDLSARHAVSTARAATLLVRYGTTADAVAAWCGRGDDAPLASLPDYTGAEIRRMVAVELAPCLVDVLFRRTDIALSGRLDGAVIAEAAGHAAAAAGWSPERRAAEVLAARAAARRHGVAL